MNKAVAVCGLIVSLATVVWVAAWAPRWIDDHNEFMAGFINHEILSILGVILAITLASASQIHLKFNEIEERAGKRLFRVSRHEVESSCYHLIISFVAAVALVFIKPLCKEHHFAVALINGLCLWLLLYNIAILFDITSGIFAIDANIKPPPEKSPQALELPEPPRKS